MNGSRLLLLLQILAGCEGASIRDRDIERIERGELEPRGAVFTCHGIFRDYGFPWDFMVRDEIAEGPSGRLAIVVTCWNDPTGIWFGWGKKAPGKLIAAIADAMEDLHRSSGCKASLRFDAVGFSGGCEAVLEAARRMETARFRRVFLLNSSGFAFSGEPRRLVEAGKIGAVRAGWSPFDLITLFAPLGAGQFGYRPAGASVENVCLWNVHLPPLFPSGRRRIEEYLHGSDGGQERSPPHTCRDDHAYRLHLADLLRRMRTESR